MKAVWYERNGAAREVLQYGDLPDPVPGPGEVRVAIGFSGVNPSDVKRRAGFNQPPLAHARAIPNMDGAGVIDQVGAGVDPARLGQRVWLHSTAHQRPFGTAAQYAVTPAARAFALPPGIGLEVGAGLGVPAMTAHRAVFGAGPVTGKTLLVTGGAGAVGFYAIQLAKWGGARVLATVSSDEKAAVAKRAGADVVINYRTENVAERVRAVMAGAGIEHIVDVDFGANLATSLAVIADNGVIATYASMGAPQPVLPAYTLTRKNLTIMGVLVYSMPQAAMDAAGADVNTWLAGGCAVHNIAGRFPLKRTADAHVAVESGSVVGKVVVEVGGEVV
jgi:NADPH2:quinone reductase